MSLPDLYLEALRLNERLHRQFLEVVKAELDRFGVDDINNVQALILFNVGKDELTVGELTQRGYYLGSNVTYNVKKMVEAEYLEQARSSRDKRTVKLHLSAKGLALKARMQEMFDRHIAAFAAHEGEEGLAAANAALRRLERHLVALIDPRGGLGLV